VAERITVLYTVNGTTCTDVYTCAEASVQLSGAYSPHCTVVKLAGGDDQGVVMYRHAEKITIRPVEERS
jgi:hypothetical protein